MTIRNIGAVPEHLIMATTPEGQQARLQGGTGDAGALDGAGIYLPPGSTVTFAGNGPHVVFPPPPADTGQTVTVNLLFGVDGLVHLTAQTTT